MEKQKITQINRYTTKKDGSPLMAKQKDGSMKPYTSIRIKTDRHGDKFLSGFGDKDNAGWNVGDEIEIEVKQEGEYLNFKTPKKSSGVDAGKVEEILNGQLTIKLMLRKIMVALKIEDEMTPVNNAREAHNKVYADVHSPVTSTGLAGEKINKNDVTFDPSNDPDILNGIDF